MNLPAELTATDRITADRELVPFIRTGVVHVVPSVEDADTAKLGEPAPTATNLPAELTATEDILAAVVEPFIVAGVVHVVPSVE